MMVATRALLMLFWGSVISAVVSAEWRLENAKLTVSSIDGSARISEGFTISKPPSITSTVDMNTDEVLRLAFTIQGNNGEKLGPEELPHQVVVALKDVRESSHVASSVVSVKSSSGKASWNQRVDRLPSTLLTGSGTIEATLLIASFGDTQTVKLPLLRFNIPTTISETKKVSTARERQEFRQGFQRQPERRHTFGTPPAEQMPPQIFSIVSAAITLLVPSLTLVFLLSLVLPSLTIRSPSAATSPFLVSLISLEIIALFYWIGNGFSLFKMMPWLLGIGMFAIFVGRTALGEMRKVRIGKQA